MPYFAIENEKKHMPALSEIVTHYRYIMLHIVKKMFSKTLEVVIEF